MIEGSKRQKVWILVGLALSLAGCGRKAETSNREAAQVAAAPEAKPVADHVSEINAVVRRNGVVDECLEISLALTRTASDAELKPPNFEEGLPEGAERIDMPCASAVKEPALASCVVDHETSADGVQKVFHAKSYYYQSDTALANPKYRGNCDLMKGRWEVLSR